MSRVFSRESCDGHGEMMLDLAAANCDSPYSTTTYYQGLNILRQKNENILFDRKKNQTQTSRGSGGTDPFPEASFPDSEDI